MFITHCPTVTLQLHNFDLFRACSFCTVAWQLARFQPTDASRGPSAIAELLVVFSPALGWPPDFIKIYSNWSSRRRDCSIRTNPVDPLYSVISRRVISNLALHCSVACGALVPRRIGRNDVQNSTWHRLTARGRHRHSSQGTVIVLRRIYW